MAAAENVARCGGLARPSRCQPYPRPALPRHPPVRGARVADLLRAPGDRRGAAGAPEPRPRFVAVLGASGAVSHRLSRLASSPRSSTSTGAWASAGGRPPCARRARRCGPGRGALPDARSRACRARRGRAGGRGRALSRRPRPRAARDRGGPEGARFPVGAEPAPARRPVRGVVPLRHPRRRGRGPDFLDQLVDVVDEPPEGFYLAITMRSDFLGDCARFPRFADALNHAGYLLRRMSEAELEEAIVAPGRAPGRPIEPALLGRSSVTRRASRTTCRFCSTR